MPRRVSMEPPPNNVPDKEHFSWAKWFVSVFERTGSGPLAVQGYPKASLPSPGEWGSVAASDPFSSIIFVNDETGGSVLAFSDGTNWRRVTDRAVVS